MKKNTTNNLNLLKVCLNTKFIEGPYGGGVKFAKSLRAFLHKENVEVVNELRDKDIDIILHINPFPFLTNASSFSFFDAYIYKLKHPKTLIVQRINECDERKNTKHINKLLIKVSKYSDFIIFIASWLEPLLENSGLNKAMPSKIILNGADKRIFNRKNKRRKVRGGKLRIVTHHWGANYFKGHDIYQSLDELLKTELFRDRFEFTFIGNVPKDLVYKNTRIVNPLDSKELANELKKHDLYLTASINEPAGMHHIEGALCGLPLLYRNSGALPEYCAGFGIEFNDKNFKEKLKEMYNTYPFWASKVKQYPNTTKKMGEAYYRLFIDLRNKHKKSSEFKRKRNLFLTQIICLYLRTYSIYYSVFWRIKVLFNIIK